MSKWVYDGWAYPAIKGEPPSERYLKLIASPEVNGYGGATVLFSHIPPGSTTGMHAHPDSDEIIYFIGRGEGTIEGETVILKTDSVMVAPKGVEHECRNTSNTETLKLFCVYIPPMTLNETLQGLAKTTREFLGTK